MSLLESVVGLVSVDFCAYLSSPLSTLAWVNKNLFCCVYPRVISNLPPGVDLNDILCFGGLQVSFHLLCHSYPASLLHLLSKPNWIFIAAKSGHIELMQMIVAQGGKVEAANLGLESPIHLAAGSGNLEVIKLLIEKGADVKAVDACKKTPLHYAAMFMHPHAIALLANAGAQLDARTLSLRTPLHYACMHTTSIAESSAHDFMARGRQRKFRYSFFRGVTGMKNSELFALLPVQPYTGESMQRQNDVVKSLLSFGASPSLIDERNITPLHYASFFGPLELVDLLLSASAAHSPINLKDTLDNTPLMYAAAAGHLDIVRLLLVHGANCATHSITNATAVEYAIKQKHVEIVRELVIAREKQGVTEDIVLKAVRSQNKEIVAVVLGAAVDFTTERAAQIMEFVICQCDADVATHFVKLLLEKGADANARASSVNSTPLHLAISKNLTEVVKMLLEKGANVNSRDCMNRSCLDITVGPWCSTPNMEIVKLVLEKEITRIDEPDFMGNTIMHRAVTTNNVELIEALVEKGANIEAQNAKGETPLALSKDAVREYLNNVVKRNPGP